MINVDLISQSNSYDSLNTQKAKSETLMLYNAEPIKESYNIKKKTSGLTNKENESWAKVIIFFCDNAGSMGESDGYAEYYAGKKYNKFKATVAPSKSSTWKEANYVYLQVLGDNDTVLYTSDSINYKTGIFDIEIDIVDQDTVSVYVIKGEGSRGPVILKNARFE